MRVFLLLSIIFFMDCKPKVKDNSNPAYKLLTSFSQNAGNTGINVFNAPASITENQSVEIQVYFTNNAINDSKITVSSDNPAAVSVNGSDRTVLSFSSINATTAQKVTLKAEDDTNVISEKVKLKVTCPGYAEIVADITVNDDDTQSIIVEKAVRILNGGSSSINLKLAFNPTNNLTLNLISSNPSELVIGTTTLTFTSANYNTLQAIATICTTQTPKQYTITISGNNVISQITNAYCLPSFGGNALGLLVTGQTVSYAIGDDGEYQKSIKHNYTVNEDGTVTDEATGLLWQRCSQGQTNDAICSGTASGMNWTNAVDYCNGLNLASKVWRLPSIQEFSTLIDAGKNTSITIDINAFPQTEPNEYWSSTGYSLSSGVWSTNFFYGWVSPSQSANGYYVRCVSGQTSDPIPKYSDLNNGTILDNATKLIWQKCSYGQNNDSLCSGSATFTNWVNANSLCRTLNLNGKSWRLPNRNELHSLTDYSKASSPTINEIFFPSTQNFYWSSSAYSLSANAIVWIASYDRGDLDLFVKTEEIYFRCVSGP